MSSSDYLKRLIKNLHPQEVFDYYDGPIFYSCIDLVGQIYLVYLLNQAEGTTDWLYLRVSKGRYYAVKSGSISVSMALSKPEEGFGYFVIAKNDDLVVDEIESSNIDLSWLPPDDYRLNFPTGALPEKSMTAVELAIINNRQVLDIAFEKVSNIHEMGAGKLGGLLSSLQNVIYALSCPKGLDIRRVSDWVKSQSEAQVTEIFASSFGVRLQSTGGDLLGDDATSVAFESLAKLISNINDPSHLIAELHGFNVLTRSRFKHFLSILIESQVSLGFDWGSPIGRHRQSKIPFNNISNALFRLEETGQTDTETVIKISELVGVNVESDWFALKIENNEIIKGKLGTNVAKRNFKVPSLIKATFQQSCINDPLTEREKWTYLLIDYVPVKDD